MYIQPNSVIQVMRGVPLNPNYKDTIKFSSLEEQADYFNNFVVRTFTQQTYQRANKNTCRVEVNAEQVYDCNYMHFRNSAFGQKNFYAFITNVEYINHNVTEITYQIDVLQTWAFNYTLGKCFVEREHANSDIVGEHLLPEPIDIDEYITLDYSKAGFNNLKLYLTTSERIEADLDGAMFDGIYSSNYYTFDANEAGAAQCSTTINRIVSNTGGTNAIISLFLGPADFYPTRNAEPKRVAKTINRPSVQGGSYVPNNNKLLTSPYLFLTVDCLNDSKNYSFELFSSKDADFAFYGSCVGTPSVLCVPVNYKTSVYSTPLVTVENFAEQLIMGGYPMCIIPIDSAKQWIAESAATHIITGIGTAAATGFAIASGNVALAAMGGIGMLGGFAKTVKESNRENTAKGAVSTNINAQNRSKDFYFQISCLTREKAKSVDDFFGRYGYACEQVKIPNTRVRKRWTYTKTNGCVVNGNLPADDKATISKIFDSGITFWTTTGTVGDYVMNDNGIV